MLVTSAAMELRTAFWPGKGCIASPRERSRRIWDFETEAEFREKLDWMEPIDAL